ncbi:hypothetical protein D3C81_1558620 [compost metagenome]
MPIKDKMFLPYETLKGSQKFVPHMFILRLLGPEIGYSKLSGLSKASNSSQVLCPCTPLSLLKSSIEKRLYRNVSMHIECPNSLWSIDFVS